MCIRDRSNASTVARRLRIDVHDDANDNDNDNAWQRGPLWPHGMGPISDENEAFNPTQASGTTSQFITKSAFKRAVAYASISRVQPISYEQACAKV